MRHSRWAFLSIMLNEIEYLLINNLVMYSSGVGTKEFVNPNTHNNNYF